MTDHDESPADPYTGPPPTEQFVAPPYPTAPYPQYGAPPYGPSPYGAPYPPPGYGYPPPGYGYPPPPGYGYPIPYAPAPAGPRRPGLVTAASVLGYINAGLLILAGLLLLFGAAIVGDIEDIAGSNTDYGTEFALDGLTNLTAAGLLIAGAVMMSSRKPAGRILLAVGSGIVLAASVYWTVRFDDSRFGDVTDGYLVWAVVFAALAILPLVFAFVGDVNRWLAGEQS